MLSKLALRPNLAECLLEDRVLLYFAGLYASQFIPSAGLTPSFVVSGFQQSNSSPGSTGSTSPGPQYFFIQVGLSSLSNGGVRAGGTSAVFQPPQVIPTVAGATIGSIPGSSSSSPGNATGGFSATTGYGGAISSGYNTALTSTNNFGMGTSALGSVAAHVSGATDALTEAQAGNASTSPGTTGTNQDTNANPTPAPPMNSGQGPFSTSQDRLLGKGLGSPGGLLIGPGMSNQPAGNARP